MISKSISDYGGIAFKIPMYLKSGNRKLKANTLLDKASTKIYANTDVAYQARSQGGSLGAEESPFLNRRSISLLKRSAILLKKP